MNSDDKKTTGNFFEKRSQSNEGLFFKDLSGRSDGTFHKSATATTGDSAPKPSKPQNTAVAPANSGDQKASGMGGGMYLGTGKGVSKSASRSPSDWDSDSDLPTGFHRPASDQPEAIEAGGDRFHDTRTDQTDYGSGQGISHGLVAQGSMRMKGTSSGQMGKHATTRFLGTQYGISKTAKSWGEDRSDEFASSVRSGLSGAADAASEGVKSITKSPAASLVAAALLAKMGLRGAKGAGRLAKKGYKRAKFGKPEKPKTLSEKIIGGAQRIGARMNITN